MAGKISAGILAWRRTAGGIEFLLAHPGGPHFSRKDEGFWGIPKGHAEPGEDLECAARREFLEELGFPPEGPLVPLGSVPLTGKTLHAWAMEWTAGELPTICSNTFAFEWPPRSGKIIQCPEIDRAQFFTLKEARRKIGPKQAELLERVCRELRIEVRS